MNISGIQETKHMLDQLEAKFPDLLKEVLRHATVQRISEALAAFVKRTCFRA